MGVTKRQGRVNGHVRGVKEASDVVDDLGCAPHSGRVRSPKGVTCAERCLVADLLYAVLMIGIFVVLALALRGLEKL
jgi:hypothetical protein